MPRKHRFRLGSDPLGRKNWKEVVSRLHGLHEEYADHVLEDDDVAPARVQVWVISPDAKGQHRFASAKMVGYAPTVASYLKSRDRGDRMTGIDAVTALRKRGFLDRDPAELPQFDRSLRKWLAEMNAQPRATYRFMIHRVHLARLSPKIRKLCGLFSELDEAALKLLAELFANDEVATVIEHK